MMRFSSITVGALETNCYLAYCEETRKCAVIDPGAEGEQIIWEINSKNLIPSILINTHGHVDHVGANKDIKDKYEIPLVIHEADRQHLECAIQSDLSLLLGAKSSPPPDDYISDGSILKIGRFRLEVLHTPGHTEGSVCLLGEGHLFSGDTLFCRGVGRTDLPGGSWDRLIHSIRTKILSLPGETLLLPGHGPESTVAAEAESNPFIR